MKRAILLFLIAGGIAAQTAALEFGINLSDTTGLNGTNKTLNLSQTNTAEFFFAIPTGSFSSVYLSGEARFSALFPLKPKGKAVLIPLAQAFRLKRTDWSGTAALNGIGLQWAVGRTSFNEYSTKILNGLFDGGKINVIVNHTDITFAAGYTGLTYKNDAKIRIDQDDTEQLALKTKLLAPQRMFLSLSSSFNELIPSHTFGIDVLAQFDLLKQKTATHTQYLIPYIHGKIGRNVSWKYWGAVQFGQDPQFFYSLASGLSMKYFNPDWLYFTVNGKLDWAAGDYDGTGAMRTFIPVTDLKHTTVADFKYRNILTAGLTASVRPVQGLFTELSYLMISIPNTQKQPVYTGSELSGKITYSFYNDADISCTGGIFIPNKKVTGAYNLRWLTELACTFRL